MTIFELGMLICFGAAWPLSIYKSWVSRSIKGKSFIFLLVIFLGYIFGIIHKVMNNYNYVLYFYILNAMMVLVDILIYIRNIAFDHPETKKDKIMEII